MYAVLDVTELSYSAVVGVKVKLIVLANFFESCLSVGL